MILAPQFRLHFGQYQLQSRQFDSSFGQRDTLHHRIFRNIAKNRLYIISTKTGRNRRHNLIV